MEMKRLLATLLLSTTALIPMQAQQNVMVIINDIKRRASVEGYVTEQVVTEERTDSVVELCAKGILRKLGGGYTLADIKPYLQEKVMKHGARQLVFVYLKKGQLGNPSGNQAGKNEPVNVEPRFTVVNTDSQNSTNTPSGATTATTESRTETPIVENVIPADAKMEKVIAPIVREIMVYKNAESVMRSLNYMKGQGRIVDYGTYAQATDIDRQYVVLFKGTPPYAPFAVLSPVVDGKRLNLETREADSLDRHEGCGAMWFSVK